MGNKSKAPDYSELAEVGRDQVALSERALDYFLAEAERTKPERDQAIQTSQQVSEAQLAQLERQNELSEDAYNYNVGTFRPLEQRLVADAESYDTNARRDQEAQQAGAQVQQQIDAQRAAEARAQASMGVNPNSGRAMALDRRSSIAGAAAKAGAMTAARDKVETTGFARRLDAASLGRNLPAQQSTAASLALNAGNSAVNNATNPVSVNNAGAALAGQGFSAAQAGLNGASNTFGQVASLQQQANAADAAASGQLLGTGIGAYAAFAASDKNMKSDIKPESGKAALKAMRGIPVSSWRYDKEKGGPDDGGQIHVGPMAQDVNREMGDKAAPGGKMVDLITLNGKTMAAVKELDRNVSKIAAKVGLKLN